MRPTDRTRGRRPAWPALAVAALLVPAVLAGLTLLWSGPQIEDDLTRAAQNSLTAAGIAEAEVTLFGRDASVRGPAEAVEVVQGVAGVRVARADGEQVTSPGDATDTGTTGRPADTAGPEPADPDTAEAVELDDDAERRLSADIDNLTSDVPITFEPDRSTLTTAGSTCLARVVERIAASPGARLQVDGYVAAGPGDGRFTAQELSEQRAVTVRDALVAGGIPADQIDVRGLGEGPDPVADADGRRVEIDVV